MISKEQEEKILKETKILVDLFLETNASDIELSTKTGISSSTVGRRLTNKENIIKVYPLNGIELYEKIMANRQNNLQKGKVIGGQASILNNMPIENKPISNIPKLKLELLYADEKKQMQLMKHIALTFRAKPPLLAYLFGIDEEVIIKQLFNNENTFNALNYLINNDYADQEVVKIKIIVYYRDLLNALKNKDKNEINNLISKVSDYKANEIIRKREEGSRISDDDLETIINYQLKYSLSQIEIGKIFGINANHYSMRVQKFLETNNELKEPYEALTNYNAYMHRSNYGKNR